MEYKHVDQILGVLTLPDPCPIRITVDDEFVRLWVGPRDWQWYRGSGELMGAGTIIDKPLSPSFAGAEAEADAKLALCELFSEAEE